MKRIRLSQELFAIDALADHNYAKVEEYTERQQQFQQDPLQMEMCPEMNPFEVNVILDTLFTFCSVTTLKNCRLVCRQWKDVSLKAWRNKAFLCPRKQTMGLRRLETYLKLLQSNSKRDNDALQLKSYPFRSFLIQSRDRYWNDSLWDYLREDAKPVSDAASHVILRDYGEYHPHMKKFLSKFQSLEILELENGEWDWDKDDYDIEFPTSNVKRLRIFRNIYGSIIRNCEGFLRCFQNLEALSIEHRAPLDSTFTIRMMLNSINSIRSEGANVMNLRELEVIFYSENLLTFQYKNPFVGSIENDIISPIVGCHFPLERLTIHVVWDQDALTAEVHPIYNLLNSCKKTLRYLKTSFIFHASPETLKLYLQKKKMNPYTLRMDAMKEVHLSNGLWDMNILAGLDLPNFEKLVVDDKECFDQMEEYEEFHLPLPFPEGRVYGSLKTLELLDNRKIHGPKTIRAFAKIMPNLNHLTMALNKCTFEIVCQHFKGLKTLNVLAAQCRYEQLDDENFTGISNENGSGGPRRPNITDLNLLTHLNVECEKYFQGNAALTDHSVVYGFLELPLLRSLNISFKELSEVNKAKLKNHIKGCLNIKVKTAPMRESHCDVEVDFTPISYFRIFKGRSYL